MSHSRRQARYEWSLVESLEDRRLFAVALPAATPDSTSPVATAVTFAYVRPIFAGRAIHAIADQSFRAVIGVIRMLRPLPPGYSFHGDIDWGDGTPTSEARFVRQGAGAVAVLGEHTYAKEGAFGISVGLTAVPPPWSEAPVRLVGILHSKADVIAADGGVTLNEPAGVDFTARLGFFRATQPPDTLHAVIDWGDGTRSAGKIVTLPTAGIVPTYAVEGAHQYAAAASYLVHVIILSADPGPVADPTDAAPPVALVAQFDSVIDVLPPLPTAA